MQYKRLAALAVCLSVVHCPAFAVDWNTVFQRNRISETVSLAETLWRGLKVGTATGLAAGYARYAEPRNTAGIWSSTALGAVAGLGVGALGEALGQRRITNELLADVGYGAKIGGGAGALAGTVSYALSGKSERVAEGTAWGELIGAGLAVGYAGYRIATGQYKSEEENPLAKPLPGILGLAPTAQGDGFLVTLERHF